MGRKEQRFHSDVPPGTGDSFLAGTSWGGYLKNQGRLLGSSKGKDAEKRPPTAFAKKRTLVFLVSR